MNYRLYDRFARPVASLAVLADDDAGWRPDSFGSAVLGCWGAGTGSNFQWSN